MAALDYKIYVSQVSGGNIVPITSTAYHLRVTPYSGNTYSATSDSNGMLNFGAIADGFYRLYDNAGNQVAGYGERWIGDTTSTVDTITCSTGVITDVIAEKTSDTGVTIDGVLIKDSLNASSICALTGNQTVAGVKTFTSFPVSPSSAPTTDYQVANKKYVDDLALIPANTLWVSPDFSSVTGKTYTTIQGAIDYAQAQTPAATSRWKILIYPTKVTFLGYAENITLQAYVDLVGVGLVRLTGTMAGASTNTRLENLYWNYGGNFGVSTIIAYNCIFRAYASDTDYILTLTGGKFYQCGFYSIGASTPTVVSGDNNLFVGCWNNANLQMGASDVGFINSLNTVTIDFNY